MTQRRTHLVLVPGFGGFDALGQIFYYAGVSLALDRWRENDGPNALTRPPLSLHVFEGLPTAGVRTRAMALRSFLEERRVRRVFQDGDRIALLGHSTGGLDIRQLLVNLGFGSFDRRYRDTFTLNMVDDAELRRGLERLVFLSVPQLGTNIADFIARFRTLIQRQLKTVEVAIKTSETIPMLSRLEEFVFSKVPSGETGLQLLAALRDAAIEILPPDVTATPTQRYQAALAREAYGELTGWLDNVETDFFAIDDLTIAKREAALPTPAKYAEAEREQERKAWREAGIEPRSYATLGRKPYDRVPNTAANLVAELAHLTANVPPDEIAQTDIVYRSVYAMTAAGPFKNPGQSIVVDAGQRRELAAWENDGIVNTASMLWPNGEQTRLIHADHGDIIGHYRPSGPLKASERVSGRQNHSYDILGSHSGFGDAEFDAVWHEIFDFCTG